MLPKKFSGSIKTMNRGRQRNKEFYAQDIYQNFIIQENKTVGNK
jgi:hypothetical protein